MAFVCQEIKGLYTYLLKSDWQLQLSIKQMLIDQAIDYGQRWIVGTYDIVQCFTVALHCWSIPLHTLLYNDAISELLHYLR